MILNLCPKPLTDAQYSHGVREPVPLDKAIIISLHEFGFVPTSVMLVERARRLREVADKYMYTTVMVDAPGFFTPYLEQELSINNSYEVVYPFLSRYVVYHEGNISYISCDLIGFITSSKDALL